MPQGLSSENASSRKKYDGNLRLVATASGWHAADTGDMNPLFSSLPRRVRPQLQRRRDAAAITGDGQPWPL
jgi:hypothetical protein